MPFVVRPKRSIRKEIDREQGSAFKRFRVNRNKKSGRRALRQWQLPKRVIGSCCVVKESKMTHLVEGQGAKKKSIDNAKRQHRFKRFRRLNYTIQLCRGGHFLRTEQTCGWECRNVISELSTQAQSELTLQLLTSVAHQEELGIMVHLIPSMYLSVSSRLHGLHSDAPQLMIGSNYI